VIRVVPPYSISADNIFKYVRKQCIWVNAGKQEAPRSGSDLILTFLSTFKVILVHF